MSPEFLSNLPFKYKNTGPLKHARIHETNMKKKRLPDDKMKG